MIDSGITLTWSRGPGNSRLANTRFTPAGVPPASLAVVTPDSRKACPQRSILATTSE